MRWTRNIPGCTYCHPQVASVGLTEAKAKEAGHEVKVGNFPFIGNGKAIALGEAEGFVKTVFDAKTGELLGAHMIGAEVTELIQGYTSASRRAGRARPDEHHLPAPDTQRDDARERARGLRTGAAHFDAASHGNRTIWIAFGANLGIAVAKFGAAAITGSSAMLTEGVHSVVDSHQPAASAMGPQGVGRPADKFHPFGYGREIYFWSFVVAVLGVRARRRSLGLRRHPPHRRAGAGGLADHRLWRAARRIRAGGRIDLGGIQGIQGGQGQARLGKAIQQSKDPPGSSSCSKMARPCSALSQPRSASASASLPVIRAMMAWLRS